MLDWSFQLCKTEPLTISLRHYWCFLKFSYFNFKKAKTKLWAVAFCLIVEAAWPRSLGWASEWLPGPTLDMREPCSCSTRLCGWQESMAGFIGRAAGTQEPRVNWSPIWCLLTEITQVGRACDFFKLKCKSGSANNCDGLRRSQCFCKMPTESESSVSLKAFGV